MSKQPKCFVCGGDMPADLALLMEFMDAMGANLICGACAEAEGLARIGRLLNAAPKPTRQ